MRPKLWCQAEELFHVVLEQSPEDGGAFLDSACGQDAELRRHVDLLVSAAENAGSFLDKAGVADLTATIRAAGSLVGQQFGHYRIESPLGMGGMGEVYLPHDTKLSRDVAIKTLPYEFARDRERVARFRRVDAGIKRQHFRRFCSQEKNQPSARMQYTRYSSF